MIKEVDVLGVFLPPILLYAAIAGLIWTPVRMALERAGFYGWVWRPALFNLAAYVATLALVMALLK